MCVALIGMAAVGCAEAQAHGPRTIVLDNGFGRRAVVVDNGFHGHHGGNVAIVGRQSFFGGRRTVVIDNGGSTFIGGRRSAFIGSGFGGRSVFFSNGRRAFFFSN